MKFLNQHGHGNYEGLLWLFIIVAICVLAVEGGLITTTIIFWKYLWARILFGILSIAGLIFLVKTVLDIWR
jgi:hypothetical protein